MARLTVTRLTVTRVWLVRVTVTRTVAAHNGRTWRLDLAAGLGMLDLLLAHQIAIGRVLSMVGATATVVILEYAFELAWFIAIPAGAAAYVTMPMLWVELLRFLARRAGRREDPPSAP